MAKTDIKYRRSSVQNIEIKYQSKGWKSNTNIWFLDDKVVYNSSNYNRKWFILKVSVGSYCSKCVALDQTPANDSYQPGTFTHANLSWELKSEVLPPPPEFVNSKCGILGKASARLVALREKRTVSNVRRSTSGGSCRTVASTRLLKPGRTQPWWGERCF